MNDSNTQIIEHTVNSSVSSIYNVYCVDDRRYNFAVQTHATPRNIHYKLNCKYKYSYQYILCLENKRMANVNSTVYTINYTYFLSTHLFIFSEWLFYHIIFLSVNMRAKTPKPELGEGCQTKKNAVQHSTTQIIVQHNIIK